MRVRTFSVSIFLALLVGAISIMASQESHAVQGELLRVDPDARTLVIQPESDNGDDVLVSEWQFLYDDDTEVSGADGIAGLARMAGVLVTIDFIIVEGDPAPRATRIEVMS